MFEAVSRTIAMGRKRGGKKLFRTNTKAAPKTDDADKRMAAKKNLLSQACFFRAQAKYGLRHSVSFSLSMPIALPLFLLSLFPNNLRAPALHDCCFVLLLQCEQKEKGFCLRKLSVLLCPPGPIEGTRQTRTSFFLSLLQTFLF